MRGGSEAERMRERREGEGERKTKSMKESKHTQKHPFSPPEGNVNWSTDEQEAALLKL